MNLGDKNEVKIQQCQLSLGIIHQYPPQNGIKLQVDPNQFPPVRWFPIPKRQLMQQKMNKQQNLIGKNEVVGCLKQFYDTVRKALIQILNSTEINRFIDNYDCFANSRFYLLIMVSFAKWRSNNQTVQFQKMLRQEFSKRQSMLTYTSQQRQEIQRAKKACHDYLQGKHENAVYQLYKEYQESVSANIFNFFNILDSKIRCNETTQPVLQSDFDSKSNNIQEQQQNEESNSKMNSQSSYMNNEDISMMQKVHQNSNSSDNPFFIYYKDDPTKRRVYPYEPSLTFKRRIIDSIKH